MKAVLAFGWGLLLILMGVSLLAWIGYNLLIEMQPEAEGRSPNMPTLFAMTIIGIGVARIRGQRKARAGTASANEVLDPADEGHEAL